MVLQTAFYHHAQSVLTKTMKTHIFRDHLYILVGDADVLGDVWQLPGELGNIARVAKNLRDFLVALVESVLSLPYLDLR